jgi:hypothetical protein
VLFESKELQLNSVAVLINSMSSLFDFYCNGDVVTVRMTAESWSNGTELWRHTAYGDTGIWYPGSAWRLKKTTAICDSKRKHISTSNNNNKIFSGCQPEKILLQHAAAKVLNLNNNICWKQATFSFFPSPSYSLSFLFLLLYYMFLLSLYSIFLVSSQGYSVYAAGSLSPQF